MRLVARRAWQALALFAAYLALAAVATFPLVLHLGDHVCGTPVPPGEPTPPLNIWAMATVLDHLPADPLGLMNGTAFYPYRDTLTFSEHLFVPALLAWPVVATTGNWVLAYNVVMLLTLASAGLGMQLLAREIVGDGPAAFVAGLLYAFHTWNVNELVRSQIVANQFFPLELWALLRFFARPTWRAAGLAGLFYALQTLSCMYWGLYLPLLVAATVVFLEWRHRLGRRALVRLGVGLAPALLLTSLFALPYLRTAREMGFARSVPNPVPLDRYFDVLPENLLYAGLLGTARRNENAAHFLGFVGMGLGLVGLVARGLPEPARRLRPLLAGLVAGGLLLSLGPEIRLWGASLGTGPYFLLWRHVPGFRNVRYPERFSIFVVLGLAPLLAMGVARLRARVGPWGLFVLAGAVLLEHLSIPQKLCPLASPDRAPSVYAWLRRQPDIGVVAELPASPFFMERADALPMYFSLVHGKRTPLGYTSYFPPAYGFMKWRLFHFPAPESVAFLKRFGVDAIVVRPQDDRPPSWVGPDPRWKVVGPFAEGHVLLRLTAAAALAFPEPPQDDALYREIDRQGWGVHASVKGAWDAIDGEDGTLWTTEWTQEKGDYYRIRLPRPMPVARVAIDLGGEPGFPMHLRLVGELPDHQRSELPFDKATAYDRLFATLLRRPSAPVFVVDILEPRPVWSIRLTVNEDDAFGMPWTMTEVRLYERRSTP